MFHGPLTFRHHFLHDYWIKSKFENYSFIKNLEFFVDPIVVEKVVSEGRYISLRSNRQYLKVSSRRGVHFPVGPLFHKW